MKDWILASATALVAVAGLAGAASAAEPYGSPPLRGSPPRVQIFPAAHAWANSMRQEVAAPAPVPARPAIVGHANIGQGGNEQAIVGDHGATIAATAWNGEHQYTGYVYSPGACDHTAPCTENLWNGYCQRPHRCHLGHHFHRHCGMGGCSTCGGGCDTGGCHFGGLFGGCHGLRLHGFNHGGCGCSTCCQPACNTCSSGFGHGLGHLGHKCRGWFHSLCNACDGGLSCGCGDGVESNGAPAGNGNNPELVPTPATDAPMTPPPADDAKSARSNTFNRYQPWSIK